MAPSVEHPLSSAFPFSDIAPNCCLLVGHIPGSRFSVVLSKYGLSNRGKRRREEEGKSFELHSDLVLVICHFFIASYRPALTQWSVQELDKVQALKLQTAYLHHVNLKTSIQILLFPQPAITTLFKHVLQREHGNEL